MFNIVLVSPRIAQNTGSIGRMCFNAGFTLHIIKPTIFSLDDKAVKRAGLDYWTKLKPMVWQDLDEFLRANSAYKERFFLATTRGETPYFEAKFKAGDFLFFGSESYGLPESLLNSGSKLITIPMKAYGRSLNLATSVGIVAYEALRQNYAEFKA